ncbi:MAG: NAD-dependent epimerase/dehydratase [Verrucomicrobia bacterium]|nr:NAD-dependent epimerase/dehydratase [Verrucomicrobiota bacterium]
MKKVLVTGATGFIGRHCISLLKMRGYEVYAISSKNTRSASNDAHWIQFDLLGSGSFKNLLTEINPSHLLHLAWVTEHGKFWRSRENLNWLKASIDLLQEFALQGGKRAVLSGTCAEYDWNAQEFIEGETACRPHTLYGSSKLSLCLILEALAKEMGFSQAWGRIFYLYGPHEHPNRFVPSVIRGLLQKTPIPCSHGRQIRDFLHVQDVADAFVAILDSDAQGVINIGSGVGVSLKEVIHKITERLGGKEMVQLGVLPVPSNDPASLIPNTTRLREEIFWTPRFSLEEGLNNALGWWKGELHD